MSDTSQPLRSATRLVRKEVSDLLRTLEPGQRIKITQHVRVGSSAEWSHTVEGTFRHLKYLATGLATDRVPRDDIIVVTVHFTKDNQELSSVTLDDRSEVEIVQ